MNEHQEQINSGSSSDVKKNGSSKKKPEYLKRAHCASLFIP